MLYEYSKIGTLCDESNGLTCSFDTAKKWGQAKQILPYSTFEEAAEDVKYGNIYAFLVPGAYPKVGSFIMDAKLVVKDVFIKTIPSLVLVGTDKIPPSNTVVLFHHPATTPLLSEVEIPFKEEQPVTSNSKACTALLDSASEALAITNELCASFYKLNVYKILRAGLLMPFICFVRA